MRVGVQIREVDLLRGLELTMFPGREEKREFKSVHVRLKISYSKNRY